VDCISKEKGSTADETPAVLVKAFPDREPDSMRKTTEFLCEQPAVARLLAQRLNVATTYLADIMKQYAGHGDHLAMVGEILQSMINLPPIKISPGSDRQSDTRLRKQRRLRAFLETLRGPFLTDGVHPPFAQEDQLPVSALAPAS
jgi:hypothetical protein